MQHGGQKSRWTFSALSNHLIYLCENYLSSDILSWGRMENFIETNSEPRYGTTKFNIKISIDSIIKFSILLHDKILLYCFTQIFFLLCIVDQPNNLMLEVSRTSMTVKFSDIIQNSSLFFLRQSLNYIIIF